MTDSKSPHANTGNETTVHNPKPAGEAERVNPTTGGSSGTIDTNDADKRESTKKSSRRGMAGVVSQPFAFKRLISPAKLD